MNITILYNSGEWASLVATMILKTRFIAETVTLVDLFGKNEGAMTSAINGVTDHTQDRVYCTTVVDASYTALGHPSTDVNIVEADDKIIAEPEDGYDATVELGENDGTATPALQAWNECYTGKGWPQIVRYLSGTYFPRFKATADSVNSTTITDGSAFTASAEIGKYAYIISATTGAGQVRRITSNTTNALTVEAFAVTPTGTVVYGIVDLEPEALREEALQYYVAGLLYDLTDNTVIDTWYKLLDYGSYDNSWNSINSGALVAPVTDANLLEEIIAAGKDAYKIQDRLLYVDGIVNP